MRNSQRMNNRYSSSKKIKIEAVGGKKNDDENIEEEIEQCNKAKK